MPPLFFGRMRQTRARFCPMTLKAVMGYPSFTIYP